MRGWLIIQARLALDEGLEGVYLSRLVFTTLISYEVLI